MVKRYFINYRGATLNYTCSRMNKTQRLNVLGTSCLLLVQNPHCNNDCNFPILLLQSCELCIKLHKGKLELLFHKSYFTQCPGSTVPWSGESIWSRYHWDPLSAQQGWLYGHKSKPCDNSSPSKIRQKRVLSANSHLCNLWSTGQTFDTGLMVFRSYRHAHTLPNLK